MNPDQTLRYALNPVAWCEEVIGFTPDKWQRDLLLSNHDRFILNVCRQAGKSTVTALLALHTALFCENSLILIASPTERQSKLLLKKIKDFYRLLPDMAALSEDNKLSLVLHNQSWIQALPGTHETIRGFSGPKLVIIDEAAQCSDELFVSLNPMLSVNRGRFVILSTPYGRRGFYSDLWHNTDVNYHRVLITADECGRISPEFLQEQRKIMSPVDYRSEYYCSFEDTKNSLFSSELIDSLFCDSVEPIGPKRTDLVYESSSKPLKLEV